jgi:hypothetical protein
MLTTNANLLRWALLLLTILQKEAVGNFLREGFSSKVGNDARTRMKLDDAGASSGMTRDMFLMKDKQWELQPIDFSSIKNVRLRRHCEKYLNRPVIMRLSSRKGKYGLRAMGELQSGQRLRGFWRQAGSRAKGNDFLKLAYDDAVKQRLTTIEFEVQLPPTNKTSRALPTVIYSIAMEPGAMNQKAVVPRGGGSVRILPNGHGEGEESATIGVRGKAFVCIPMKSGLVDPGWAKGRTVFRRGRSVGPV